MTRNLEEGWLAICGWFSKLTERLAINDIASMGGIARILTR